MKIAFTLYSILSAPIAAIYAYVFNMGLLRVTQKSGLNPGGIIDMILLIGVGGGVVLFLSAFCNFLRFYKVCHKQNGENSYSGRSSIILNFIPVLTLFIIIFICCFYLGRALR